MTPASHPILAAVIRNVIRMVLKLLYRVEVRGIENIKDAGPRAIIVANHVSFLDPVLLGVFLPQKPVFAVDPAILARWWMRPFTTLTESFPLNPFNPLSVKALVKLVRDDRHCVIFPEGRITVTGGLMKIYDGPSLVADKADATLVPVRLDGPQRTHFSRLKGIVPLRLFPKIRLTILPPRKIRFPAGLVGRARRRIAGTQLYDMMCEMMFESSDRNQTLFEALREARRIHGADRPILEDAERKPIGFGRAIVGAHVLGGRIARITTPRETVGVLLPNALGAVITFFALQAYGRVPAMLNFSAGAHSMIGSVQAARIKTILTARRFVELGKLEDVIEQLSKHATIRYLEDIRAEIGLGDKLSALFARWRAGAEARRLGIGADDPAVVLFTSGSEGVPKGVVLSHRNLQSNRYQLAARVDFNPTDIVFNALPIFHSFGMTGGMLLPILSGIRTFLYPSPLHYRIVPALAYDANATILFGTDTFLMGYLRRSNPFDFYRVRYVFAGAEKVKEETRRAWSDKFGIRILEGYGTTETSPVLAANTPMHFKAGTVGRFLPSIRPHLEPVPGIDKGGRLIIDGPNVMLGYLKADNPGVIQPPEGGRYDTGDIVDINEDGFVTILGRVRRFAKVAGEMIGLGAVEDYAAEVWPDSVHAVVAIPDARRGEQLVLVTESKGAKRSDFTDYARRRGISELMVPRDIRTVDKVPRLATGKTDYVSVEAMVKGEAV